MSRSSALILFGLLAILIPFSGLPSSLRTLLAVVVGAGVSCVGISMRAREARRSLPAPAPPPVEPPAPHGVSPI